MLVRFCGKMTAGLFLLAFPVITPRLPAAQETNGPPAISETVITNLVQMWALSAEEKSRPHPARMELLIYYCDPDWNVFWGRSDELNAFLPLKGLPVPLQSGEKILIDGLILPVNQEFIWDKTSIKILSRSNTLPCVSVEGKFLEDSNLSGQFVETEALVDSQVWTTPQVLRLRLLAGDFRLAAFLSIAGTNAAQTDLTGKYVQIKGVYTGSFDAFGKAANVTLWTPGLNCIETIGSLETDRQFSIPVVSSENFRATDPHALVRVAGVVRSQQPGQAVTIWDDAGQIRISTRQQYPLELGDHIEAVGHPVFEGIDRVLQDGLFRLTAKSASTGLEIPTNRARLRLADQIRALDQESIAQQLPVSLEGVVTWADPAGNFIFLLDNSGGIRVDAVQIPERKEN